MLKNNLSYFAIVLVAIVCIWNALNTHMWEITGIMCWDAAVYYAYLPKTINHKTDSITIDEQRFPAMAPTNKYVTYQDTAKGTSARVIKTTMGMAFLYTPFYLAAWLQHYFAYGDGG